MGSVSDNWKGVNTYFFSSETELVDPRRERTLVLGSSTHHSLQCHSQSSAQLRTSSLQTVRVNPSVFLRFRTTIRTN
jgi:hypothetical protein